jgi:hypothetical protein
LAGHNVPEATKFWNGDKLDLYTNFGSAFFLFMGFSFLVSTSVSLIVFIIPSALF